VTQQEDVMLFLLHHAVDQAAERDPEQEAVRCRNQSLSYAELVQRANALAHVLVNQGVRRSDRVGIYLHKSLESAVAVWGILKAGAAYVPLDPETPADRLFYILQHCGIRHLVTEDALTAPLGCYLAQGGELDALIGIQETAALPVTTISWANVYEEAPRQTAPAVRIIEQDLAYIMYTSGSTGPPKGIMHTHRSGLSYAQWAAHEYGLGPGDRIANHAPLHFDISTFDWFAGALGGSTVVVMPEEYSKLPASYSALLARERITVIFTVPFALVQLLLRGALPARDLSSMRWVIFGGEPFPPKHLRALMQQVGQARFSNIYGPAEVNGVTFHHVSVLPDEEPIPIGKVCPFAQALVLDEDDQPVGAGQSGELLIRSSTMMQGYWRRPELNSKAFYRRHIVPDHEEVFYRTGDQVQLRSDGNYLFLGRKDRQIKTRGFRVELDEIEACLLAHEDVGAAAVFVVPDGAGNNQIHAAIIAREGASPDPSELTRHVAALVPWYAVPAKIEFMPDFPRTASDKIDRRALQARHVLEQTEGV
jgi:amino acid adenylation domain-containing protein